MKTTWKKNSTTPSLPLDLCNHWGKVPVITHHDGLLISAGDRYIVPDLDNEVVLDLAGYAATPVVRVSGPALMPCLSSYQSYTRIAVDWSDMSAPALRQEFWTGLLEDLTAGRHNLTIMCMGGHGRTGTALAIVATLLGAVPDGKCPVQWVRDHYCQEAVESKAQARYITLITGKPVTTAIDFAPSFSMKGSKDYYL